MKPIKKHRARSLLAAFSLFCSASPRASAACFDFSGPIKDRLPLPAPLLPSRGEPASNGDAKASGEKNGRVLWAAIQGDVPRPIEAVLKEIVDHSATKSPRVSDLEIQKVDDPNNALHQKASFTVRPFPLMKVNWTEDWVFTPLAGSLEKPQALLVSFEKTSGTSHIRHLCGSFLLRKTSPSNTRVFVYHETIATGRTVADTLKGVSGILQKLREAKTE